MNEYKEKLANQINKVRFWDKYMKGSNTQNKSIFIEYIGQYQRQNALYINF